MWLFEILENFCYQSEQRAVGINQRGISPLGPAIRGAYSSVALFPEPLLFSNLNNSRLEVKPVKAIIDQLAWQVHIGALAEHMARD
jgi:hypothetical protein